MDLDQIFRYNLPITEISYDVTPNALTHFDCMLGPMKFNTESSPSSPLYTHLDNDTFSALSNSPSQNLSLEVDSSVSKSPKKTPESPGMHLVEKSFPNNAICSTKHVLQELEPAFRAPGNDQAGTPRLGFNENQQPKQQLSPRDHVSHQEIQRHQPQSYISGKYRKIICGVRPEKYQRVMDTHLQKMPQGDVKRLLIECAWAISENRRGDYERLMQEARSAVSISGAPIQRLGAYMLEGLVARQEASGTNIYRALRRRQPESKDLLKYMHILYEICPCLKFGYMAANGAIAEAFRNEDHVHIIDFQISQGTQWTTLIQALAARPGGPPHVRITGIDDPISKYARGDSLEAVGKQLAVLSDRFQIPVVFHAVPVFGPDVTREMLDVRPGEALAVNFTLQLHHTPDESVDVDNPRDGLLRMVKSLSPKVITLVEQESNTNTTPFFTRFLEALSYYSAMFESIDMMLPRGSKEQINIEQHCLATDIVNIIACEGKERVERHELLGKWRLRLSMAGFHPYPLNLYVNSVIRSLLRVYSEDYTLLERDGAILLGWKDRNLISASAWH